MMDRTRTKTEITFLGTASAIPDEAHENTHFVVKSGQRVIMVDCTGNPVVRLKQADIPIQSITDLILTHFHPDHVSGVPLLLMGMWLLGRQEPLHIYGLHHVIDRVERMMDFFDWGEWPGFFPVVFYRLPERDSMTLLAEDSIHITASPVCHLIPTIGFRMDLPDGSLCYSCDTAPCDAVRNLAGDVDILIHEATGKGKGHSSAAEAGHVAREARAGMLCLVHYPPETPSRKLAEEAKTVFEGQIVVAEDFMTLGFV
jgi:ribonuclease Z